MKKKIIAIFIIISILMPSALCVKTFAANNITVNVTGDREYDTALEVIELTNNERVAEGLSELTFDKELTDAAMQRAAEIGIYFSHTRPNGTMCNSIDLPNMNISGENIAAYHQSAAKVVEGWMNSTGHRANILNADFKSIGVGCLKINGLYHWVQLFGYQDAYDSDSSQISGTQTVTTPVEISESLLDKDIKLDITVQCDDYDEPNIIPLNTETEIKYMAYDLDIDISVQLNSENVVFESSNPEIASISGNKITMLQEGTVTVSTVINGKTISTEVTSAIEPTDIYIENDNISVNMEETAQINASLVPSNANVKTEINYSSVDSSIATVDKNGVITPVSVGTTTIWVFNIKKSGNFFHMSDIMIPVTVTVNEKVETPEYNPRRCKWRW